MEEIRGKIERKKKKNEKNISVTEGFGLDREYLWDKAAFTWYGQQGAFEGL